MNNFKVNKKENKENLIWVDEITGETFHAGVAFYIKEFGEYRLILDAPRTVLYLRANKSSNGKIHYLIHAHVDNNGVFTHRVEVGHGHSSDLPDSNIYMKLGRHSNQQLVLLTSKENKFY